MWEPRGRAGGARAPGEPGVPGRAVRPRCRASFSPVQARQALQQGSRCTAGGSRCGPGAAASLRQSGVTTGPFCTPTPESRLGRGCLSFPCMGVWGNGCPLPSLSPWTSTLRALPPPRNQPSSALAARPRAHASGGRQPQVQMPAGPVRAERLEVRADAGAVRELDAVGTWPAKASPKRLYATRLGGSSSALPEPPAFPEKLGISIFT